MLRRCNVVCGFRQEVIVETSCDFILLVSHSRIGARNVISFKNMAFWI